MPRPAPAPDTVLPRPPAAPLPAPRRRRTALRLAVVGATAVVGTGAAAAAVAAGEALPGTRLAGLEVGGLGRADLQDLVRGPVRAALVRDLPLRAGGTSFPVEPGRVGLALDQGAAVQAALDAGRGGALGPVRAALAVLGVEHDADVAVAAEVDPALVRQRVEQVRAQVDRDPSPGGFRVGPDLAVTPVAPQEGRAVDVAATAAAVQQALEEGVRAPRDAVVDVAPAPVEPAAVQRVVARARQALAAPVVLASGDARLEVPPALLAPVLASRPDGDGLALVVDEAALAAALAPRVEELEQEPRSARAVLPRPSVVLTAQGDTSFSARPASVTVEPGAPGRSLDPEAVAAATAAAVLAGERAGALPLEVTPPRVDAEALGAVDQLVGTFTTSFPCCQPRVTNIRRIAALLDGRVVLPGEVLDVNALVGPRTRAGGFVADGAIIDGELVDVVGGGISQFATTLYNASWFAGLEVEEHRPHSRYISRYPPGREATLSYGSIELVVRNTTGAPLVLRTAVGRTTVTTAWYGRTGDRTVRSSTGPRSPRDGGGFRVSVVREVLQGGRTVDTDRTSWTYQPPLD